MRTLQTGIDRYRNLIHFVDVWAELLFVRFDVIRLTWWNTEAMRIRQAVDKLRSM